MRIQLSRLLAASVVLAGCSDDHEPMGTNRDGPEIVAMSPAPSQSYVSRDQVFVVEFSEPMDAASVESRFQVLIGQSPVAGAYAWDPPGSILFFTPTRPLDEGAEVQVRFGPGMRGRTGRALVGRDGQTQSAFSFACNTYAYPEEFVSNGQRIYFTGVSDSGQPISFALGPHVDGMSSGGHWPRTSLGWTAAGARHGSWSRWTGGRGMMGTGGGGMGAGGQTGFHGMTCASCHGPDGRGGRLLAMGTVETPDIRYEILVDTEEHIEEEGAEHTEEEATEEHVEEEGAGHTEEESEEHAHAPYTDDLILRAITQGLNPDGDLLNAFMPRWSMAEEDLGDLLEFLKTL